MPKNQNYEHLSLSAYAYVTAELYQEKYYLYIILVDIKCHNKLLQLYVVKR